MVLLRHLARIGRRFATPVMTLGNFDGVHRGHQEILQRLVAKARALNGTALVLTFHPHPTAVLVPERAPLLLTDWRGRIARIASFGVEAIIVQHFTRAFSQVTAETFVRRFLVEGLGVRAVVVGHRVSFGHQRGGGTALLEQLGAQCGFDVEVVGPVEVDGIAVSSSVVRRAIAEGNLDQARALLGRAPSVGGRVIHGHHRGQGLGFPTANLRVSGLQLPPDGVYAVRVAVADTHYGGVANLGFNPTFGAHRRSLETHLFDCAGNLYGRRIDVSFVKRLRGEIKFPSVPALIDQIARDAAAARQVLAEAAD